MSTGSAQAYISMLTNVQKFVKGADRSVGWLKALSVILFVVGTFLLLGGGLSGSIVSAGSGAVGLAAAAWSVRQLYHVWKDGRFLEMLKNMADYAQTLPDPQRTEILNRIAELMLEWAKAVVPLP